MSSNITIEFCDFCDNMVYMSLEKENKATWYCKNCNHKKDIDEEDKIITILDKKYNNELEYLIYLNPYLKYDNTLPHIHNLECTNKSCTKKEGQENDIIYIRYNNEDMKYIYICTYCNQNWLMS
jgi:DNA-directed RNA polymerase subunit M/transcription elongation factor TFIIS